MTFSSSQRRVWTSALLKGVFPLLFLLAGFAASWAWDVSNGSPSEESASCCCPVITELPADCGLPVTSCPESKTGCSCDDTHPSPQVSYGLSGLRFRVQDGGSPVAAVLSSFVYDQKFVLFSAALPDLHSSGASRRFFLKYNSLRC
jgi:hypothetical protein